MYHHVQLSLVVHCYILLFSWHVSYDHCQSNTGSTRAETGL